ncbi:MAG TPA: universal stress protein [Terriglobales bacterium]
MKTLCEAIEVKVKNVLFATDFSKYSNAALPYALAIAHQYGSKLYGVHVLSPETYILAGEGWIPALELQDEQRRIDANLFEQQLRGVPHEVMSPVGDIVDVIFRLVHDHQIDLLVVGTHGRSGLPKLLLGSVAEKIFRQSPIPVLTVGPHVPPRDNSVAEFSKIVFATNFNQQSLAALPYAVSMAQEHQTHLYVLHVLEQASAGTVNFEADMEFNERRMKEMFQPDTGLYFEPQFFVEPGNASTKIREFATKHGADLIVMGVREPAHGIGTLTHFGHSLAQEVVAYATCPVLTVRG